MRENQSKQNCLRNSNNSNILLCFLASLYFTSPMLFAEELQPKNLIEIYHQAEIKHPTLIKANARRDIAYENLKRAKANAFLPKVDFTADFTNSSTNTELQNNDFIVNGVVVNTVGLGGRDEHISSGYTISLVQPLFHQNRLIANDQAILNIKRSHIEAEILRQNLILEISKLYFEVLKAEDSLKLAQIQKSNLQLQLAQSKERFEAGEIAIMNLNETKAGYFRAEANEIEAKQTLEQARTAMQEVTGEDNFELRELREGVTFKLPEPNNLDLWLNQALTLNPLVAYQKLTSEIASKEIKKKEAENLPEFDIVASSSYLRPYGQDARFFPANVTNHSIGLKVTINLFEGGQIRSRSKEAYYELEDANATLAEKERIIRRQTQDAFNGIMSGVKQIPALLKSVNAQKASLESIRLSIEAGRRTALDLVLAGEELFRMQRDYTTARYNYLLNTVRLKHATGILTEDSLVEVDSLFINVL